MVGISLRASEPLLGLPGLLLSSVCILTRSQVTVMLLAPGHTLTATALEQATRQASATSRVCQSPRGSEAPPGARPNPTGFTGAWDKASDPLCTCPSVTLAGRPGAWVLSPEGTSDVPAPFSHHLCVPTTSVCPTPPSPPIFCFHTPSPVLCSQSPLWASSPPCSRTRHRPLRVPAAQCQEGSWIQLPMDMGHHNVLETEKLP